MKFFAIIFLLMVLPCVSAQTDPQCIAVCQLGGFYSEANGYGCAVLDPSNVVCFCPGRQRVELNAPCRPCNPISSNQPALCNRNNSQLIQCLETNDFGTGYACMCQGNGNVYFTTNYNCDPSMTLTTRSTITTAAPTAGPVSVCANGGVLSNGACQCPSGYGGAFCDIYNPAGLCQNVICKNNGVCSLQNPNGPYIAVCRCRTGTTGDYCELNGTLGYCSQSSCLNGAACQEVAGTSTRYAFCRCQPGYRGVRCETPYFSCTAAGNVADSEMLAQGKYFTCTANPNGTFRLEQKSCAKGLRFNQGTNQCGY